MVSTRAIVDNAGSRGIHHEFRIITRESKRGGYLKGEEVIFIRYGPYIGFFFHI